MAEQLTRRLRPQRLAEMTGNELNKELVRAIARNPMEAPSTLIMEGSFGSGKSLSRDTLVKTSSGIRRLGNIIPQESRGYTETLDVKVAVDGASRQVRGGHVTGLSDTYDIVTDDGHSLRMSWVHPMLTWDPEKMEFTYKTAELLKKGDYLVRDLTPVSVYGELSNYYYILGLLNAYGIMADGDIRVVTPDLDIAEWVENFLKKVNAFDQTLHTSTFPGCGVYQVCILKGSALWNMVLEEGMYGRYSGKRVNPQSLYNAPASAQRSYLTGLMDACGTIRKGCCEMALPDGDVVDMAASIVEMLGVRTSLSWKVVDGIPMRKMVVEKTTKALDWFHWSKAKYQVPTEVDRTRLNGDFVQDYGKVVVRIAGASSKVKKYDWYKTAKETGQIPRACLKEAGEVLDSWVPQHWVTTRIVSKTIGPCENLVDLCVPEGESFVANGLVSHNCVAEGTHVLTDQGYKKIETMFPKDAPKDQEVQVPYEGTARVFSTSGWVTPTDVYHIPDVDTLTIETHAGNIITVTPQHRLAVLSRDMQVFFQKACDMVPGQVILLHTPPLLAIQTQLVVTEAIKAAEGPFPGLEIILAQSDSWRLNYLCSYVQRHLSMARRYKNGCTIYGHNEELKAVQKVFESFCMVAAVDGEEMYLNNKSTMLLGACMEQLFGYRVVTGPESPMFTLADVQRDFLNERLAYFGLNPVDNNLNITDLNKSLKSIYGKDVQAMTKDPLFRALHTVSYEQTVIKDITRSRSSVYDLTVPGVHNYTTNGFLSHNTTTARILAKALNCEHFTDDVCGECEACKSDLDSVPFYAEYDVTAVGNVESVKQLRDTFSYAVPNHFRVIVLDEFQAASKQAQAALLKVFEEAPARIKFVLCTTDPQQILPTIRSRSLEMTYTTQPHANVVANLKESAKKIGIELSDEMADLIATRSKGHMRNAHMLLDQLRLVGEEAFKGSVRDSAQDTLRLLIALKKRNKDVYFQCIDSLLSYPLADLVEDFQNVLLNLLRAQMGSMQEERYQKVAAFWGKDLLRLVRICTQDWMVSSFANDITLQTALLALYQLLTPAQQVAQATNRNAKS